MIFFKNNFNSFQLKLLIVCNMINGAVGAAYRQMTIDIKRYSFGLYKFY